MSVNSLEVRYLVVESSFAYLEVVPFEFNFSSANWSYSLSSPATIFMESSVVLDQSKDSLIPTLKGYDIQGYNYIFFGALNLKFDLNIEYSIINSTTLKCLCKSSYDNSSYVRHLSIDIVVYHRTNMNNS
jgi:hypothetical protein